MATTIQVFDEVLPSIRRHGIYAIDEQLQNDEFLEEAIRTLRAEGLARLAGEQVPPHRQNKPSRPHQPRHQSPRKNNKGRNLVVPTLSMCCDEEFSGGPRGTRTPDIHGVNVAL